MTRAQHFRFPDQRGAIIIHVALALLAILAFTAFVIDYGVMWVSRRQAQNAADAGALAGAVSIIKDGGSKPMAEASARHFANRSPIWGEGNSNANVVVTFSGDDPGEQSIWPCLTKDGCIRVDVYRNTVDRTGGAVLGNPIPTYFGLLAGVPDQGVRATATARVGAGNMIRCMLPFAVIDRWADNYDPTPVTTYFPNDGMTGTAGWSPNDAYQQAQGDIYIPPYENNPNHTGWKVTADYGRQLVMKFGDFSSSLSSGWANKVDLPGSTGGNDYGWDIANCNPTPVGIANAEEPCAPAPGGDTTGREINGCISASTGITQGPTRSNINTVVNRAPDHRWDWSVPGPNNLMGAVVDGSGRLQMSSSRIRPLAIIDINHYIAAGCSGTTCIAKIANIIGFFVEGMCGDVTLDGGNVCEEPNKDVVGRIVTLPGAYVGGVGEVVDDAAFVKVVRLVR